jgi:hypothetical protein
MHTTWHWERDGFAFWAVSDVNAEDLRVFAGLEMQQSCSRQREQKER